MSPMLASTLQWIVTDWEGHLGWLLTLFFGVMYLVERHSRKAEKRIRREEQDQALGVMKRIETILETTTVPEAAYIMTHGFGGYGSVSIKKALADVLQLVRDYQDNPVPPDTPGEGSEGDVQS